MQASLSLLDSSTTNEEMMRQASLSLLDAATTDEEAHPRVWAPFVVVGEPARVD
jgi:CHAT domain-containing protein